MITRKGTVFGAIIFTVSQALFSPALVSAKPTLAQQRSTFKAAYESIQEGKTIDLAATERKLDDYVLTPYLEFATLYPKVRVSDQQTLERFLQKNDQTPFASRLRSRWLYTLASRKNWPVFLKHYKGGRDVTLQCYALQARLATEKSNSKLLDDITDMWLIGKSQVKQCDPAFDVLYQSGRVTPELIWKRIRLSMQANNSRLASHLAKRLNKADQDRALLWRNLANNPKKYLLDAELKKDNPLYREMLIFGLEKLASRDVNAASRFWLKLKKQHDFTFAEQDQVLEKIAFTAVQKKHPRATDLLDQLGKRESSGLLQRYQIRQAVTTKDWKKLEQWTRKPAHKEFNELRWDYWRARALHELGRTKEANNIFNKVSLERDYYGFLAAEKINKPYNFNDRRLLMSKEQKSAMMKIPGVHRAHELLMLKMYEDARREWTYITTGMDKEQLKHASVLAHDWGWYDRTILTLGKAKAYDDLERRFPLPYNDLILAYAKKRNLPASTIYTLMRSESAFIHDVKSWAGAMGLMQVMPATAKQTAKKIGLNNYKNAQQLYDPKTNITLGTAYLKEMLEKYDGSLIMAAAAYNAGPHRVKRWRPESGCKNGEEWVEMIPFNETRRYVRRALFYSVLYQWRMGEKIDPIESRLTPVPAEEMYCGAHQKLASKNTP